MALAQAFYAVWLVVEPNIKDTGLITKAIPVLLSAVVLVAVAEFVILKQVSATKSYSDEREYICAAWLCVGYGVILMLVEGLLEPTNHKVQFLFEEPLLGIGATFALLEEGRLFKRTSENED